MWSLEKREIDTHRDIALRTCIGVPLQTTESTRQKGYKMTYGIVRSGRPGKHTLGRAFCNNFESRVVMESLPDQ